ncbi:MAG: N-acetyl-gamma-glutamyl-phosphate reductase [Alicyclobacillaceae bacterium]|nr:N-acetyl-gamma-glutamyl-phosphate reductase [Alicyclobacillaceae bacterium]
MVRVAVVGATGYAGVEAVRLLARHPEVSLVAVTSDSYAGRPISEVYPHLRGWVDLVLEAYDADRLAEAAEVVFLALPAGLSTECAPALRERGRKVIDLGGDFRIPGNLYREWYKKDPPPARWQEEAVYGLTEWAREAVAGADFVSNPGCYPTATLLGLVPAVRAGVVDPGSLVIDAKSGVTGAGRGLSLGSHFSEVYENFKAYKVGVHQHTPEIEYHLGVFGGREARVSFTAHLVPMNRGILVTAYGNLMPEWRNAATEDVVQLYREVYAGAPFVRVRPAGEWPQTKEVRGTNLCDIGLAVEGRTGRLIVVSVIDNLVKGAAGQAVQNLNVMMGWPEDAGLAAVPLYP